MKQSPKQLKQKNRHYIDFKKSQEYRCLHKTETQNKSLYKRGKKRRLLKIFRFSNPNWNFKNKKKRKRKREIEGKREGEGERGKREGERQTEGAVGSGEDQRPKPCRSKNTFFSVLLI